MSTLRITEFKEDGTQVVSESFLWDINKPMQANNKKLSWNFLTSKPYSTKNRGVEVIEDKNGNKCVYARLYKTYIVKRDSNGDLYITYGGWPTATTTKAINACLPIGWTYSKRQLISPNKTVINVSANWTAVKEPVLNYIVSP
jgi:hypothetical protein